MGMEYGHGHGYGAWHGPGVGMDLGVGLGMRLGLDMGMRIGLSTGIGMSIVRVGMHLHASIRRMKPGLGTRGSPQLYDHWQQ